MGPWVQPRRNPTARSLPRTFSKIFRLNIYAANSVFLPVWTDGGSQMGPVDVGRQNAEKRERLRLGARGQRSGESLWRPGINVYPLSLTSRAFQGRAQRQHSHLPQGGVEFECVFVFLRDVG